MDDYTSHAGKQYRFDLRAAPDNKGDIRIELETIPHPDFPGERPKKVWGTLASVPRPARDRTLIPWAVEDEETWEVLKEASFEGGHLIGLHYGGPDHPFNIAPMLKGANSGRGTWGVLEREFSSQLSAATAGEEVYTELNIGYDDSVDPRIPSRLEGFVERRGGAMTFRVSINFYVGPPADVTNCLNKPLIRFFRDVEAEAAALGYATLVGTPSAPNAPLDVIDYKNKAPSIALRTRLRTLHPMFATYPLQGYRKKKGAAAATMQRRLMMFYNRFRNLTGPFKTTDLTAEDSENLGLLVREWQAQYDHTKTKSSGGTNAYANLVLTHHRVNNRRGAGGTGRRYRFRRHRRKPTKLTYKF